MDSPNPPEQPDETTTTASADPIPAPASAPEPSPATTPQVNVILVARKPGEWFGEVLTALAAQDHPSYQVTVVDASRRSTLSEQVNEILPGTEIIQTKSTTTYGAAAALVADRPTKHQYHLFLHDDLVLDATALRRMVEAARDTNAGITGLKTLNGHNIDLLADIGATIDRYGTTVPRHEPGEIDQGQYDADREVFVTAAPALLVRTDLYAAVGGFDPALKFADAPTDLCWRARLLGAIVATAPNAVGRQIAAKKQEEKKRHRRNNPERFGPRHRLRLTWANQPASRALLLTLELLAATLIGVAYGLLRGRFRYVQALLSAWLWNIGHFGSLRTRRALLRSHQGGGHLAMLAWANTPRHSFRRAATGRAPLGTGNEAPTRLRLQSLWAALLGPGGLALMAGTVTFGFGSRHLITRGLPAIGRYQPLPADPLDLINAWRTTWRTTAAGLHETTPDALAFLGGLSWLLPLDSSQILALAVLAMFPLGALGVWRMVQPVGGGRSRAVAVILYLALPVPWNALAEGQWAPLAIYATLPWISQHLARAQGVVPYGQRGGQPGPGGGLRSLWAETTATGMVLALALAFEPTVVIPAALVVAALFLGSVVAGSIAGLWRLLLVTIGATLLAALIHLPATLEILDGRSWETWFGPQTWTTAQHGPQNLLLFNTGTYGYPLLAAAFLIIPGVALVTTKSWHLAIAVRSWFLIAGGFATAYIVDQGWWSHAAPSAEFLLVPAGLGIAWAAAAGTASLGELLANRTARLRYLGSATIGLALMLAITPIILASFDGHWALPAKDFTSTIPTLIGTQELDGTPTSDPTQRVLWIGDPQLLPAVGVMLDQQNALALTDGYPTLLDQAPFTLEADSALNEIRNSLTTALTGGTSRLGEQLGQWSVGHIVLVERSAPAPYGNTGTPLNPNYFATMTRQLDLQRIEGLNRSVNIFTNTANQPIHGVVRDGRGRTVPARTEPLNYTKIAIESPVDGAYRWRLQPEENWQFTPGQNAASETQPGPHGEPTIRMARSATGQLALNTTQSTARRTLQLAALAAVALATSWAHAGRRGKRR